MEEDEDHIFTSNADLQAGDSIGDCSMEGKYSSNESDECQGFMCQDSLSDVEIDTPKVASDVVIDTPKVGMEFDTYDAIVDYYARYAKQEGFAVYKRSSKKGKDGKLRYVTIECHRAGKPSNKGSTLLNPRPQSKLNCPARIRASLSPNDKFTLTFVCLDHNHERSPGKVKYFRSNRRIDEPAKRKLVLCDLAGIKLNQSFDLLQIEAGGPEKLPFSQRDCRNYLSKARRLRLAEGDAEAMNKYFLRMKTDNEEFFYALDLDDKGRLRNVFWADARSRAACKEFGDVVTFDTTYLVNRYDMPFAPFVTVNHHGKSVLLGCGLVSHEDTMSFIWLFKTWLACMQECAPKAIITDQCAAMKNAIKHVFPATHHRWCIWHIMRKVPEKLSRYKDYERIRYHLHQAVYDSLTKEEFEASWSLFITKYGLHNNKWLEGLYVERARWVPVFLKDIFWAGMSASSRSESMNSYFDKYINARTTLKQFVEQYENALSRNVEAESEADANSWKSFIPCISKHDELERQFQSVYTNNKVREFQKEIRRRLECQVWTRSEDAYVIKEKIHFGEGESMYQKLVFFEVSFNEETLETQCSCRLFEFRGMVCAHQLTVWNDLGVENVPDKYVFKRWCKNVKRAHTKVRIGYDKSSKGIEAQFNDDMYKAFKDVVESVQDSKEKYDKVMKACHELKQEFNDTSGVCASNVAVDMTPKDDCLLVPSNQSTAIQDPEPVRRRGRPPYKRKVSIVEKVSNAKKQKPAACQKAKDNKKKQGSSNNEGHQVHQQIVTGTQHSMFTLNSYPGHMAPFICETSSQNYVPIQFPYMLSQESQEWNIPQGGALEQLRQIECWAGSQICLNGEPLKDNNTST